MSEAGEDLDPLVTECPSCSTRFRVTEAQLQVAAGRVRCGACLQVFVGTDYLVWDREEISGPQEPDAILDALLDELEGAQSEEERQPPAPLPTTTELPAVPVSVAEAPRDLDASIASVPEPVVEEPTSDDAEQATVVEPLSGPDQTAEPELDPEEDQAADDLAVDDTPGESTEEAHQIPVSGAEEVLEIDSEAFADEDLELAADSQPFEADQDETSDASLDVEEDLQAQVSEEVLEPAAQSDTFDLEPEPDSEPEPAPEDTPSTGEARLERPLQRLSTSEQPVETEATASDKATTVDDLEDELNAFFSANQARKTEWESGAIAAESEVAAEVSAETSSTEPEATEVSNQVVEIPVVDLDELEEPEPESSGRGWKVAIAALLVVALIGQVVWFMFDGWAKDPEQRWLPEAICSVTGCEIDPLLDLDQLLLTNVVVREHPELAQALVVDVLIVNSAEFDQAFPEVELTFNSTDGNLVAWRRFKPDEYLAGEMAGQRVIPAKTPVHVSLEIADPGPDSLEWDINLR